MSETHFNPIRVAAIIMLIMFGALVGLIISRHVAHEVYPVINPNSRLLFNYEDHLINGPKRAAMDLAFISAGAIVIPVFFGIAWRYLKPRR